MLNKRQSLPLILGRGSKRVSSVPRLTEDILVSHQEINIKTISDDSIRNLLDQSRTHKRKGSMESYQGPIGISARIEFFDTYKSLNKCKEQIEINKLESSPNIAFLEKCEKQKLKPKPLGIVRRNGSANVINASNLGMGDQYANAFSKSLKNLKSVEILNIKGNRLSNFGSLKILNRINSHSLRELNLANNRLGSKPIEKLVDHLANPRSKLMKLNLEETDLTDKGIEILCKCLSANKRIKVLNLAKNQLSEHAGKELGKMLRFNKSIKKLDLH